MLPFLFAPERWKSSSDDITDAEIEVDYQLLRNDTPKLFDQAELND